MKILNTEITTEPIGSLELHPDNPRRGDLDTLADSITTNGFWGAIVCQKSSRRVLAGNHRLIAARKQKAKEIPVVWVDVDDETANRILIADNRISDLGTNDTETLYKLLSDLNDTDTALQGTGYDSEDLSALLDQFDEPATHADLDSANDGDRLPIEIEAVTQIGDRIEIGGHTLHCADCLQVMQDLPDNSIDAICTDPPYGIGFMGKGWDCNVPGADFAAEALRVLKPGGHLIAFAACRTVHRLAVALEDSGFEIRDQIAWIQWQGFPKSKQVALSIDKGEGLPDRGHRVSTASRYHPDGTREPNGESLPPYKPQTEQAQQWAGWGTALKPSQEPAILARKPLIGTIAENVIQWGTGGINVDACRMAYGDPAWPGPGAEMKEIKNLKGPNFKNKIYGKGIGGSFPVTDLGRWPANIYHCPKPSRGEREQGCDELDTVRREDVTGRKAGSAGQKHARSGMNRQGEIGNYHPTVKPIKLMRWLCRLITPPGGVILEPFAGSGTTLIAAEKEGFRTISAEREPAYCDIIQARLKAALDAE